jgi:hypothetical protein
VAVNLGRLSPSYSGDVNYVDLPKDGCSLGGLHFLREGMEELGISHNDVDENSFRVLAISSNLGRGGKPQIILEGRTHLTAREVRQRRNNAVDKWESRRRFFWAHPIRDTAEAPDDLPSKRTAREHSEIAMVSEFVDANKGRLSLALLACLVVWLRSRVPLSELATRERLQST